MNIKVAFKANGVEYSIGVEDVPDNGPTSTRTLVEGLNDEALKAYDILKDQTDEPQKEK